MSGCKKPPSYPPKGGEASTCESSSVSSMDGKMKIKEG